MAVFLTSAAHGCTGQQMPDAPDLFPGTCNPVAQTRCAAGEKCTAIQDRDPTGSGFAQWHTGCVPDGMTPSGGDCLYPSPQRNGGADTCIAGYFCVGNSLPYGRCANICDPGAAPGQRGGCASDQICRTGTGVFSPRGFMDMGLAGVCVMK
jgi:hypothetical protein